VHGRISAVFGIAAALIAVLFMNVAHAAGPPAGQSGDQSVPADHSPFNGTLSNTDINNLATYADRARQLTATMTPAEKAKAQADAKVAAAKLASQLQVSCDVADAGLVGIGTASDAGKQLKVNIYEAACANGGGAYVLYSREPAAPFGFSCFFAQALEEAQQQAGKAAGFACSLPEDKDLRVVAASILSHAGAKCEVIAAKWFGQNLKRQIEFNEVACADKTGYLILSSLPGSPSSIQIMSCADAAKKGIKCEMTDAGPVSEPVTLDALKAALAQHGINCPDLKMRVIGQESIKKRYVVEYLCPSASGVAYIPMQGNTNKFETITCVEAANRNLGCTLSKN
jgi:hypothetical protein